MILYITYAAAAKSLQSCPTLCDPTEGRPSGSPVPGILKARTLKWVAISFSNAWKWKVKVKLLSCVQLLAMPWTAAYQAPPSMGLSRQEYWSGVPSPSPYITYICYYIIASCWTASSPVFFLAPDPVHASTLLSRVAIIQETWSIIFHQSTLFNSVS